jgi:hypothetical protein
MVLPILDLPLSLSQLNQLPKLQVILNVTSYFFLCPFKIDVAFKIYIGLKFNKNLSQIQ